MIEELNRAVSADEETETTREKRTAARAVCRKALDNINTVDNNCPILLDKLTFNLFLAISQHVRIGTETYYQTRGMVKFVVLSSICT